MMDGRDFGPPRSVHVPPPLLSGLAAMESHRLGASAAPGRMPPSPGHLGAGHPAAALHSGKFLSPTMNMQSHHGDAFPGASSFLGGYMSSSNPHAGPSSLPSDPAFRAPNPPSLQMAQLWASHSHEGFAHLPAGLYPGPYLPLGHLEHPQLGQHSLFDSQKEGFYLPGSVHSQSVMARSLVGHLPSALNREKTQELQKGSKDSCRELGKDKPCKSEAGHLVQRRERIREETRPHSVVDLTQDTKPEDERRVFQQHSPAADIKPKYLLQPSHSSGRTSSGPPSRYQSSELERRERVDDNYQTTGPSSTDRPKRLDSVASSLGTLHVSYASPSSLQSSPAPLPPRLVSSGAYPPPHHLPPSLYPHCSGTKEQAKEHRVTAPTYVPSVEVYDERKGPIQIASQARDNTKTDKSRDRDMNRAPLQLGSERTNAVSVRSESPCPYEFKRDFVREEGSVIRANTLVVKKPPVLDLGTIKSNHSPITKDLPSTKHTIKMGQETESRIQEREMLQRSGPPFSSLESTTLHSAETKWKPFEMGNYATSHMAALAAQHTHGPRGEEDGKRMYLDRRGSPGSLQGEEHKRMYLDRRGSPGSLQGEEHKRMYLDRRGSPGSLQGEEHNEVSAMQSLIKYSGNFSGEVMSKHGADSRTPFGGLGNLKMEASQHASSKAQHLSGKQLKREPERPESAKSFNRDGSSSQGEAEVRHPPVGIAVAVARQRDNSSKLGSVSDRDRPILAGGIKVIDSTGPGQEEEEQGQERTRHHDGRLLSARLEHEQEKALRESKDLADYPQLHPPLVSVSSLNPNLMVTGGSPLAGAGRWPADPTSHLTSHPWLSRPGPSSMWLPGSPYGLGAPSLHQPLPPGYPPTLPGSIPQAYQFARDPQTGQLVVIPTEHLSHYTAEMLERGPPLWPAVYPPAGSSLQHAHQLQLLSHQQLVRQQELYMIQQQAAQVMELQRNAQFVERLKEQRADMEDKAEKRVGEGAKASLSSVPASVLHSRKPPPPSPTPSTSHKKAVTPLAVTPLPSPVTSLKSEDRPKVESTLPQQSYSHPSTPAPQPLSLASALSPPPSPIHPKQESVEVSDKEELDVHKQVSASFPSIYPEIPPGYPYQSITASFSSHYPYLLQPATAADAEGLAPAVPLQAEGSKRIGGPASVKPSHMCSPVVAEALQGSRESKHVEESVVPFKEEPGLENNKEVLVQDSIPQSIHSTGPISNQGSCTPVVAEACCGAAVSPMPEEDEVEQDDKEDLFSSAQQELYQRSGSDLDRSPAVEVSKSSLNLPEAAYTSSSDYTDMQPIDCSIRHSSDSPLVHTERIIPASNLKEPMLHTPDLESTPRDVQHPCATPPVLLPAPVPVAIQSEDPMAGMLALLTASELPQSGALTTMAAMPPTGMVQCPGISLLESTAAEGMALLSQMAELEMQRHQRDSMQGIMHCGLESLLEAGRQVLLEAIERQPQVSICLPRELNPNKKYSWRQKKDEPMFSKSSLDGIDAMEVDYRVRLAELQRCYKDKQRELIRLQRRRDKVEKQQMQQQQLQQQQQEERNRNLARRGPGRPRKRKHGLCALSPPSGKLDAKCGRLAQSLQYSEDSESGEVLRKRFRSSTREEDEDEDMDVGILKAKKRSKSWNDQEASSSYSHEVPKAGSKKSQVSEQEQLASKLDKALSLTKLGKSNKTSCKFVDGSSAKSRTPSGSRLSLLPDMSARNKMAKSKLSKELGFFHKSSKGGKSKMSNKLKPSDSCLKGKGQRKASNSPVRSEISSYSNNTDSEEDSMKDGWPPHGMMGKSGPCAQIPGHYSTPSKKKRPSSKRTSASSSSSSCLKSKQGVKERKQKHFALLLQEAGVSSSEDSFDQEYFTERDDYEDEDDDEEDYDPDLDEINGLCSSSLEESGLGLLARFAASAIPSPITSGPLSLVQLEAKQKAKKKEERQSLLGPEFEFTDSESDIKIRKFPSLLHGKRSAPELPLLPPASVMREDSSPGKRGRKPKSQTELSLSFSAEGSDEERWICRRSERIFLHDAAQAKPSSPSKTALPKPVRGPKAPLHGSKDIPKPKEVKALGKKKRLKELPLRLPPLSSTPSESAASLALSSGRKSKIKPKAREVRGKGGAVSKLMESMAADEDFEPNQDSSFSEDENPRLSTERPCTPAPRNCVLNKDELQDGLRVLIPMDDKLLYAGHVNTVHSPDIYSVVVEGERGNRPHIYCLEQLLQEAIIDVKPPSVRYLPQGTRIAAYWSQQYRCLYPGTVVRGSPDMDEVDDLITVEFDDGDTGRIPLSHIRLLPPDYKIQCAEPSPALLVASTKKRARKGSKDVPESKETSPKTTDDSARKNKGRGRKPKPKPEPELAQKEHEKPDQSAPGPVQERPLTTQKSGPLLSRKSQPASPSIPIPAEGQKKTAVAKPPAKVHSQPKPVYSSALYGKVLSVDLYNDPSASLASFMSSNESGKAKAVKRVRKSEDEGAGFGVKTQRKQSQTEILIKLDHEGVMSPKTKKTKALMMMEGQNRTKRDNKAVMGVNYTTVTSTTPTDKTLKPKTEPENINPDSVASYGIRKLGSSTESRASVKSSGEKEAQSENCSSSSSSSSESDGEEETRTSSETKAKQDSSSTSSRASSPTSSSSSSSSSSSTAGFNSSSSSSSSSSTTSDEESSCSSDEEAPADPQPLSPQEQPPTENEEEDVEEKAEVKTEPPPNTSKVQKQQVPSKQQAKQQKVKKSVGRPKRREGIHLPTTKELAKRQRLPSVENRPKISAFLPARQLWKWFGKPTQRRGMKGKAKKLFYKAIMRGKEMIRIGDCAVFLSAGRPNLPFIGHIQSMWESWGNNMVVRVKWFYHPEETNPGKKLHDKKNWDQMSGRNLAAVLQASNQRKDFMERALYQSSHVDENDVQTISHKCLVVSLEQYEQMIKTKKYQDSEDLYYLAGTYEPTTGMIFNTDGVPVIC